jgi:hypothetical protein
MSTTVIHADDLIMANRQAVQRHYNRTLSSKMINALDEDGINIVQWRLAQDDFMRLLLLLKLKDRDEPVMAWLDMSYDRFNALPRLEQRDGEWVRAEATA